MILKIMGPEPGFDTDENKSFRLVSNVNEVNYKINEPTGETILSVLYAQNNRSLMEETFVLQNNAYLMNDDGKTIQSFTVGVNKKQASKETVSQPRARFVNNMPIFEGSSWKPFKFPKQN